jgi:predicted TIM-barrel fold metal-dependent hydrolase
MDRLVCGDVGYGKTEVAIRAAFKAVMDGKQVAVLVPTTVLAQQHYNTLRERLSRYPVEVAMLSRFRTREQQNRTIAGLKDGSVDWFWPEANKHGLNVMFIAPGQTAGFGALAERYPRIHFIVDHMGIITASVKAGKAAEYIGHTVSLAKYPNVSVKLSGLANNSTQPYPFNDINEHVKRVVGAFGPQRCFWGSDITVAFKNATYKERVRHLQEVTFLSESDKDWIMGKAILQKFKWA